MSHLAIGKQYIQDQLTQFHQKLGDGQIELSHYIAFVELCTKALKVIEALEEQLEEKQ